MYRLWFVLMNLVGLQLANPRGKTNMKMRKYDGNELYSYPKFDDSIPSYSSDEFYGTYKPDSKEEMSENSAMAIPQEGSRSPEYLSIEDILHFGKPSTQIELPYNVTTAMPERGPKPEDVGYRPGRNQTSGVLSEKNPQNYTEVFVELNLSPLNGNETSPESEANPLVSGNQNTGTQSPLFVPPFWGPPPSPIPDYEDASDEDLPSEESNPFYNQLPTPTTVLPVKPTREPPPPPYPDPSAYLAPEVPQFGSRPPPFIPGSRPPPQSIPVNEDTEATEPNLVRPTSPPLDLNANPSLAFPSISELSYPMLVLLVPQGSSIFSQNPFLLPNLTVSHEPSIPSALPPQETTALTKPIASELASTNNKPTAMSRPSLTSTIMNFDCNDLLSFMMEAMGTLEDSVGIPREKFDENAVYDEDYSESSEESDLDLLASLIF